MPMRMNDIKAGHTYSEKRFGKITRYVVAIGREFMPGFKPQDGKCKKYMSTFSNGHNKDRPGVLFRQEGFSFDQKMPLEMFVKWCGEDVTPNAKVSGVPPQD